MFAVLKKVLSFLDIFYDKCAKIPNIPICILQEETMFTIPWKHAARHGWEVEKDACLFKSWAIHTGVQACIHIHANVANENNENLI